MRDKSLHAQKLFNTKLGIKALLCLILPMTLGCNGNVSVRLADATQAPETPSPEPVSLSLQDTISGDSNSTYSASIDIAIEESLANSWCLIETASSEQAPIAPKKSSPCFTATLPVTYTLSEFGSRKIYLFITNSTESDGDVVLVATSEIIYQENTHPILNSSSALTEDSTPVIIFPLANDSDQEGDSLLITSVGISPDATAILNANQSITLTPSPGFRGETSFSYTVADSRGDSSTNTIYLVVATPFTWVGGGGDDNWSNSTNWCGSFSGGECQKDGAPPTSSSIPRFNSSCSNCNVTIDTNISIAGIVIEDGFSSTITQALTRSITIGNADWIQNGGTFIGGDAPIFINSGEFILNNGSFTSTTSDLKLRDFKGGYSQHDYFSITRGNLFQHNNGRVWFHLNSSNHPTHHIKITGNNPLYNVLVKRDGGSTDDVMLTTASSPDKLMIQNNLNLENISIKGEWEVQGNIYYGPQYGTYVGYQNASITFSGNKNQTLTVDAATGFSRGDVTINKSGGNITLGSNIYLIAAGQDLSILSDTAFNMSGYDLDINSALNLTPLCVLDRNGGVLSYGTWNGLGTITP